MNIKIINNIREEIVNNENLEEEVEEIFKNNIKNYLNLSIKAIYIL